MKMERRVRLKSIGIFAGTLLLGAGALLLSAAEDAPVNAPPPALQQGLSLTIESVDAAAGGRATGPDTQSVRLVGLYVPTGQAPSAFTPAGRFRATWEGYVNVKLRERFAFIVAGRGAIKMTIDEKPVLDVAGDDFTTNPSEEVRLKKGANHVVIAYESPAGGDASVRLMWTQKGVPPEPVPPTAFTHDASIAQTHKGNQVREGRFLIAEMRCTKCHSTAPTDAKDAMPELAADAPTLKDVGARLNANWMAGWINNPKSFRRDAHMPRLFVNADASKLDPRAIDAAAYLASLGSPGPDVSAPDPAAVKTGGELFASLYCAACHTPPSAASVVAVKDATERIPLAHAAEKFTPSGLQAYLANPQSHYAWNPMPNFKLSDDEAATLAAYIRSGAKNSASLPAGDVAKGKQLVFASGCLNCHELENGNTFKTAELSTLSAESWSHGCMSPNDADRKSAPVYALSDSERVALKAFAETDHSSLTRDSAAEFSTRQFAAMRCAACHPRDGAQPAVTTTASADVNALYDTFFPNDAAAKPTAPTSPPQPNAASAGEQHPLAPDQRSLPLLTWVGEKLRPEWSASFIKGEVAYKPRYYLRARMPAFVARGDWLARGFAAEHGFSPTTDAPGASDPQMASAGQKLVGANGGFSCVQCHAVGPQGALAPFEAPALNFQYVSERLRKPYYDRWMRNPIRVDPTTKMPQFADADMQTAIKAIDDGDAAKQFEAIWHFLLIGKDIMPPQP